MTAKPLLLLTLCSTFLFLSGCAASLPANLGGDCRNKEIPALLDATDLKSLFQDIASELCLNRRDDGQAEGAPAPDRHNLADDSRKTVMVTDFADLQSFLPNQPGLLMGELMRGGLNDVCGSRIIQAEFAKYFKLSEKGLIVLTRQVSEIKQNEYSEPEVVVGTYSYLNNNKVMIFVRRINTQTGIISRMVTRELDYTCSARSVAGYAVK